MRIQAYATVCKNGTIHKGERWPHEPALTCSQSGAETRMINADWQACAPHRVIILSAEVNAR